MGDLINKNKVTAAVIISLLIFTILSFSVLKPYVDKGDRDVINAIDEKINASMDTLIHTNKESVKLIEQILNEIQGNE